MRREDQKVRSNVNLARQVETAVARAALQFCEALPGRSLFPAQHVEPGILGAYPLVQVFGAEGGLLGCRLHRVTLASQQEILAD